MLRDAFDLDEILWDRKARWFRRVALGWRLTAPRSRRGRPAEIDADEVERLRSKGYSYAEIETMVGTKKKSAANKISKNKRRTPM